MEGSCHCGRATIRVAAPPAYMNDCNCTLCMKAGALWGYYPPADVTVAGESGDYARADMPESSLRLRFCEGCGSVTRWERPGTGRMGVNMRLFDPAALGGVEVRYLDGRGARGHDWGYYRAPTRYDATGTRDEEGSRG